MNFKQTLLIVSLIFLAACQDGGFQANSTSSSAKPKNAGTTIIGGEVAQADSTIAKVVLSFRSLMAPLENQTGTQKVPALQCSASALTKRVVLTAAHCINGDNASYVELADGATTVTIPVVKTVIIEDYKTDDFADLALVLLKEDLPGYIETISIPNPDMKVDLANIDFIAAGYGRDTDKPTPEDNSGLGVLRVVLLKIVAYDFHDSKFLVDQSSGKGFCLGDSGGPGMVQYDQKLYLMGIAKKAVSSEENPDPSTLDCSFRGAYVNVLKFKAWIEKTTGELMAEAAELDKARPSAADID